jgi:hypothetical protein
MTGNVEEEHKVSLVCPQGHTYREASAQFCPHCGVQLAAPATPGASGQVSASAVEERLARLERTALEERLTRLERTALISAAQAGAIPHRSTRFALYALSLLVLVILLGAGGLAWVGLEPVRAFLKAEVREVVQPPLDSLLETVEAMDRSVQRDEARPVRVPSPLRNRVTAARQGYLVSVEVLDAETHEALVGAHVELNTIEVDSLIKGMQEEVLFSLPSDIHLEAKTDARGRAYFALPPYAQFITIPPTEYVVSAMTDNYTLQSKVLKYNRELKMLLGSVRRWTFSATTLAAEEIEEREPDEVLQLTLRQK